MQIVLGTGSWFVAFVPKYWCLLCRFCAKVLELCLSSLRQITGAWYVAFDCPNYRWLRFRCMLMHRAVAWLPLRVSRNVIVWFDVLRGLSIDGCMNYDVPQHTLAFHCNCMLVVINVSSIVEICCDLQNPNSLWSNLQGFRQLENRLWWTVLVERGPNAFACL